LQTGNGFCAQIGDLFVRDLRAAFPKVL